MACRLHPIRTGTAALTRGYVYRGEPGHPLKAMVRASSDERLIVPLGAFLVEHPTAGPVLIDTGMHPRAAGGRTGRGVRIRPSDTVPQYLRAQGIEPADVRLVVMTHLHVDHTSAMPDLPEATFVIDPLEWRAAKGRLAALSGYRPDHLPPEQRVRFVGFDSAGEHDLLGDGSLRLFSTPGHTPGHLSVLVETDHGPVFVLGDAVYTLRNLTEDILPWRSADEDALRSTMRRLRAFADSHPEVPLIPTHDPDVWERL
jgi:N-acyl homoserine lactone hydrolase